MNKEKIENLVANMASFIRHNSTGEHTNEIVDLTLNKCRLLANEIGTNVPFKHFPLVCQWFNDLLVAMGIDASTKGQFYTIIPKKEICALTDNYTETTHITFEIENFYKIDGFGYSYDCLTELKDLICNLFNPDLSVCFSQFTGLCRQSILTQYFRENGTVAKLPENCFIIQKQNFQKLKK